MFLETLIFESMVLLQFSSLLFFLKNDFRKMGFTNALFALQGFQLINCCLCVVWLWPQAKWLLICAYALSGVSSVVITVRLWFNR